MTSDAGARAAHAVDPSQNVVLEASAGTGKTRVLVERYVNLLLAGVDPDNILAITFTRKAAAEMRQRIVERLKEASRVRRSSMPRRWRDLRGASRATSRSRRSTRSACRCCASSRSKPTSIRVRSGRRHRGAAARSRRRSIGRCASARARARDDDDVALVFAQLGERRLRAGLAALLDRRLVAPRVLRPLSAERAARSDRRRRLSGRPPSGCAACSTVLPGGLEAFLERRPRRHRSSRCWRRTSARWRGGRRRVRVSARRQAAFRVAHRSAARLFPDPAGRAAPGGASPAPASRPATAPRRRRWKRHRDRAAAIAPAVAEAIRAFRRDLNVVLSRGVWRIFAVALDALPADARGARAARFLRRARARDRAAEADGRVRAEPVPARGALPPRARRRVPGHEPRAVGAGGAAGAELGRRPRRVRRRLPPSIFIVGDRKQSIYGFRDAEVARARRRGRLHRGAAADGRPRQAISVSFRAVPALLAFVNDVFEEIERTRRPRRGATRSGTTSRIGSRSTSATSGCGRTDRTADCAARAGRRRDRRARPSASPTKLSGCSSSGDGARPTDRRAGRRGRPTSPSCSARARAIANSRRRSSGAACRPTSTRAWASSSADEIQDAVALLRFLARPDVGPPRRRASCARASCGCRTTAVGALVAARWRRPSSDAERAGGARRV